MEPDLFFPALKTFLTYMPGVLLAGAVIIDIIDTIVSDRDDAP